MIAVKTIDRYILFLLSFIVLVDMLNGFFIYHFTKLPISQAFKFLILVLMFFRTFAIKDVWFLIIIFIGFQISPFFGLLKTGNPLQYFKDVTIALKWFTVPLSFFYFKALLLSPHFNQLREKIKKIISKSIKLISFNLVLGIMGLGWAFYHHGYGNATGTKGYIFAGNELTILILAIAFITFSHLKAINKNKQGYMFLILFLFFAFIMTSKTMIGGVLIVYLIPLVANVKLRIKKKQLTRLFVIMIFGLPALSYGIYLGVVKSGFLNDFKYKLYRNDFDLLTAILSNRNNFIEMGLDAFGDYNFIEKFFGLGQTYYVAQASHTAEVDFFTMLFSGGIIGLIILLSIITVYFYSAIQLMKRREFPQAKSCFLFLIFILVISNLSGHIFGSGIAGFFIGAAIAFMFYKSPHYELRKS